MTYNRFELERMADRAYVTGYTSLARPGAEQPEYFYTIQITGENDAFTLDDLEHSYFRAYLNLRLVNDEFEQKESKLDEV